MITRIEVYSKVPDTRAAVRLKSFKHNLELSSEITQLEIADVYTLEKEFSKKDLEKIAHMLISPVTQTNINPDQSFAFAIETGFLPGVTDNIAHTTKEMIEDLLKVKFKEGEAVYSSQITFVMGDLKKTDAETIAGNMINPLIQRRHIKDSKQFKKDGGMDPIVPKVHLVDNETHLGNKASVLTVELLNASDAELTKIGKEGVLGLDGTRRGPLALDLTYMKTIQKYFKDLGRNPTDIELESLAQTWSEHCKHTIFADPLDEIKDGLFKTYIVAATKEIRAKKGKKDITASVFTDNSGAIIFDDQYLITHKAETHNSPSALDPFGGSITGIVGVNRDSLGFGMGAKPIANTYGFMFADPNDKRPLYKGPDFTQKMLSPRRIMEGVIAGVNAGGNQSGIPSPQGFMYFDERYKGKPLVFVGTVGLIPKTVAGKPSFKKKANKGDLVVVIGGRVGLDGIHGATFSSEAMDSGSPSTAVQIGDPITQKKLSDAIVSEARDMGLYTSITDNGAGGISCSVAEMAKESGGVLVNLEKVPLKYHGLHPWQIWISESQERMTLSIPSKNWKKFEELMKKRGVEATVIGEFTNSGKCVVKYGNETIMDMEMEFLHNGLPQRVQKSKDSDKIWEEPKILKQTDYTAEFLRMLNRLNLSSYEFISTQYDHTVQGNSALGPLQGRGRVNSETSIIRPVYDSLKGAVLSQGFFPAYSEINSYNMAAASLDTAVRNAVVAGADPERLAILDNFLWCSSTEEERLGQLKQAVKACYDYALEYETPFISGKDSMFNDFKGFDEKGKPVKISIPPTLIISSIGLMDDVTKAVSLDFKMAGDLIYVLGETNEELGGSEYYLMLAEKQKGAVGNSVPVTHAKKNFKLYKSYAKALTDGLISSGISITRGGLGVALAKSSMGGQLGAEINLKALDGKVDINEAGLYSESTGRILVSVNPKNRKAFEKVMQGNSLSGIGIVTDDGQIRVQGIKGNEIIKTDINKAHGAYIERFKGW